MEKRSIMVLHLTGSDFGEVQPLEQAPDLIVVSGDLARNAKPSAYLRALKSLTDLCQGFGLGPDRVAMVPGGQDVNDDKCAAYFLDCKSEEQAPRPPYWPKWKPYERLFNDFYRDVATARFLPDQWWSVFPVPDLKVIVAGLNSTVTHTHKARRAECGGQQLSWFADELDRYRSQGWLCVGLMHHHPVHGHGTDRLHDSGQFLDLLAPRLHVLFHGRPGRAAAERQSRLPLLGADCHVVRIWPDRLEVPGERPLHRSFAASAAFREGPPGGRSVGVSGDNHGIILTGDLRPPWPDHPADDLLARVHRICEARLGDARVEEVRPPNRAGYLRVTRPCDVFVSCFPIGVCENELTWDSVEEFIRGVDAVYRAGDPSLTSYFVYEGGRAPSDLEERARAAGVRLQCLPEFQGLYDLRPYADMQARRLDNDNDIYPPELYVGQRFSMVHSGWAAAPEHGLLERLREWASDHDSRFIVVLGDFGFGKTFLLRELARAVHARNTPPIIPVLVELRQLDKAQGLVEMLAAHLAGAGEELIDLRALRALIEDGRILLLFDGFDELVLRVTYQQATKYLETLMNASSGRAKIMLTSRTQHFLSDLEVETALSARLSSLPGRRLVKVLDFETEQILEFLTNRLGDASAARERLKLLEDIRDLLGLSRNPRMLSFIARLNQENLLKIQEGNGSITAAALYRELLEQWLVHEYQRCVSPGSAPGLTVEERWSAVTDLALRMWRSGESTLGLTELGAACEALTDLADRQITTDEATHMVGSGTLLVRGEEGRFSFVHGSVMEWLVANHLAKQIKAPPAGLDLRPPSELLVEFLLDLAGEQATAAWADLMARTSDLEGVSFAMEVIKRLDARRSRHSHSTASMTGADLRGWRGEAGTNLAGRDLERADLREAMLSGVDLTASNLRGADLRGAVLSSAPEARTTLAAADLRGTDLSGARLIGVDLRGAKVEGANWRRAALIGALLDDGFTGDEQAFFGAALPDRMWPQLELPSLGRRATSMAWHPAGELVATAENGAVCLWDMDHNRPIATLAEQDAQVVAVSWHPQGTRLTTLTAQGSIYDWNLTTRQRTSHRSVGRGQMADLAWCPGGETLAVLSAHGTLSVQHRNHPFADMAGDIRAFAWHPDATTIALISHEGRIEVRDRDGGRTSHLITDGTGPARDAAWSPDGSCLAVLLETGTVQLWELDRGHPIRQQLKPEHPGLAIAWHPQGTRLAIATVEGIEVRNASTFDLSSMKVDRPAVRALAWHPSGDVLASGGSEGLHLWDAYSGCPSGSYAGVRDIRAIAWRPGGESLAITRSNGTFSIYAPATGRIERRALHTTNPFNGIAFDPGTRELLTAGFNGLHLVDLSTGKITRSLSTESGAATHVAWNPTGDQIATAGQNGICLWDPVRAAVSRVLSDEPDQVDAIAWHPSGASLTTSGARGVTGWPLSAERPQEILPKSAAPHVTAIGWHPDSRHLSIAGADGAIRVWDTLQRRLSHTLLPLPDGSAAFSADGLTYKYNGDPDGRFWWSSGLCTFAPGELDPYEPALRRVPYDTPLADLNRR